MIDLARVLGNHGGCPVDDKGKAKCTESNLHDGWPERVQKGYQETPKDHCSTLFLAGPSLSLSPLDPKTKEPGTPQKKSGQNGNKGRERGGEVS